MRIRKLALILALSLVSCSSQRLFKELSTNPLNANIRGYEHLFEDIDKEITKGREYVGVDSYIQFDVVDGCRGDRLMERLREQVDLETLTEKDLLFVFVGASHINSAYLNLRDFRTFVFSEFPYVEDEESYKDMIPFVLAQYSRKAERCRGDNKTAIIYGDDHSKNFDFSGFFPNARKLKKRGIERVVFACERFKTKDFVGFSCFEEHLRTVGDYTENKSMVEYLSQLESSGIKVDVVGLEY